MALGKQSIIINSDDLVQGLTTSANLTDGGMSPETEGVNLIANPGVLYATNGATDLGNTGRAYPILCSCNDIGYSADETKSFDRIMADSFGYLYGVQGGALEEIVVTNPSGTFYDGQADLIYYGSNVYMTATSTVAKYTITYGSSPTATQSVTWWTASTLNSAAVHPMLVFNKVLFIADGNLLHTYDGSSQTAAVLTLYPNEYITALDIDPGSGRMLVATSILAGGFQGTSADYNSIRYTQSYIGLYDGTNPTQFLRKVPVDASVTSFRNVGGTMYCVYGGNIGKWTGSGIDFVRNLHATFGTSTPTLIYKNRFSHINKNLLFTNNYPNVNPYLNATSYQVISLTNIKRDQIAFSTLITQGITYGIVTGMYNSNTNKDGIMWTYLNGGDSKIHASFVPLYDKTTVLSTGDNSPLIVSKKYTFPRPCTITQVRVFFEDQVAADATDLGNLAIIDDNRNVVWNEDLSNPSGGVAVGWLDKFPGVKTSKFQLKYQWKETSTNHGINSFIVFYNPIE